MHTDDPGRALSLGVARGAIEGVEIANMHAQTRQREERLLHAVPDVPGGAARRRRRRPARATARCSRASARDVVDGGPTMNPSTADLVAAIERAPAPRGRRAAEQRQRDHERRAGGGERVEERERRADAVDAGRARRARRVRRGAAPTRTSAALTEAVDGGRDGRGDDRVPRRAAERRRGAKGKWLGLAEGEPVAGGETFDEVARAVLEQLLREPRGVVTLLTGDEPPALDALLERIAAAHPDLELDVHEGGQPHYPLLLAAE